MKMGGVGTRIDIPLGHINAAYVRSHFDGMEVGVPDGPRANELLFALAMARGPRIHHRMFIGILGALIGGLVLRVLTSVMGAMSGFVGAVLGAMLLIWLWRKYRR